MIMKNNKKLKGEKAKKDTSEKEKRIYFSSTTLRIHNKTKMDQPKFYDTKT